jgi:hypothetical protein
MVRPLLTIVLALSVAGCGGESAPPPSRDAAERSGTSTTSVARTGPVGDGATASCVESYSPSAVAGRAFAFDGTVTSIAEGTTSAASSGGPDTVAVTFAVNEWFQGGMGDTATVDMMSPSSVTSASDTASAYEEGTRLLVAGEPRWGGEPLDDAIAWTCGFTRYYEASVADEWRRATG